MPLKYNGKLIPRAKELRRDMTPQEKHLWYDFLAKYPIRFQRQKTIGNFIADFYCCRAKLIVEVDGSQHYTENGIAYDRERTAMLSSYDLHVMRFANNEITENFDAVCQEIHTVIQERINLNSPDGFAVFPREGD